MIQDQSIFLSDDLPLNLSVLREFFKLYHNTRLITFKYLYNDEEITQKNDVQSIFEAFKDRISKLTPITNEPTEAEAKEAEKAKKAEAKKAKKAEKAEKGKKAQTDIQIYVFDFDKTLTMHGLEQFIKTNNDIMQNKNKLINCLFGSNAITEENMVSISDQQDADAATHYDNVLKMLEKLNKTVKKIYIVSRNNRNKLINVLKTLDLDKYITGILGATDLTTTGYQKESNVQTYIEKLYNTFFMNASHLKKNNSKGTQVTEGTESTQDSILKNTLFLKKENPYFDFEKSSDWDKLWASIKVLVLDEIVNLEKQNDEDFTTKKKQLLFIDDSKINTDQAKNAGYNTIKPKNSHDLYQIFNIDLANFGESIDVGNKKKNENYKYIFHEVDRDYFGDAIKYLLNSKASAAPVAQNQTGKVTVPAINHQEKYYQDFKANLEAKFKHIRFGEKSEFKNADIDYVHFKFETETDETHQNSNCNPPL